MFIINLVLSSKNQHAYKYAPLIWGILRCYLYVGSSAMRRSVAPNGSKNTGVSALLVVTGEVGGASAALWAIPHVSRIRPCRRQILIKNNLLYLVPLLVFLMEPRH